MGRTYMPPFKHSIRFYINNSFSNILHLLQLCLAVENHLLSSRGRVGVE